MAERGDLAVLHEPFCNLEQFGETDIEGRTLDTPAALPAWLCELLAAVRDAGGNPSVVIDSDDLVARPEATMAAYCALGANGGLTGHPASYMDEWPDTDQETTTIMDAALGHVPRMCLPAARRE